MKKQSVQLKRTLVSLWNRWEALVSKEYAMRERLEELRLSTFEKISASTTKRGELMTQIELYDKFIETAERREKRASKKAKLNHGNGVKPV